LLAALVALHVCAALHHAFVRRDRIMQRMWPRKARAGTP
jgi:cytochrome b561